MTSQAPAGRRAVGSYALALIARSTTLFAALGVLLCSAFIFGFAPASAGGANVGPVHVAIPFPGDGEVPEPANAATDQTLTVCASQGVPGGYVILSASNSTTCPAYPQFNRYQVGIPGSQANICSVLPLPSGIPPVPSGSVAPIPTGYVVLTAAPSTNCPNGRIYTIRRVSSPLQVCSVSPIPAGYVIGSATNNVNCPATGSLTSYQILLAASGMQVCSISKLPAGYVVIGSTSSVHCPASNAHNYYRIQPVSSPLQVCSNSTMPDGYVIASAVATSGCPNSGTLNRYNIKLPGTAETVCANSPVPSNYVVVSYGTAYNCPDSRTKRIQRQ
ncbi:MAG: hypothetical protein ABW277_15420 [Longimicrobiaceae bacterium]